MARYPKIDNENMLNKGIRNVAQTAILMVILTLCSKFLGFLREMIMANFFGANYIVDSYVMATAIPGILFGGIFISVAIAYMPTFSQITESEGELKGNRFTSQVINLLLIVSLFASVIGIVFSNQLVSIFASGFSGETAKLTAFFVKITFSYTLFSSAAGIIDSYLQYKGVFLSQIIAGFAQNIMIIAVIIISAYWNYYYLAFGMLIGVASRFVIVALVARKKRFHYTATLKFEGAVKNIAILAIPVFIGSSIQQISTFVDKTLASRLIEGSVSALNYAMLLIILITSLTTGIISTIIYPKLAQANSLEDYDKLNSLVSKGMSLILVIAVPSSIGAIAFNTQVVQIVYERGAFDSTATTLTTSAFAFYAIGLTFMAMNDLLTKVYYSMHNMKLPMIFAGVSVIIDVVLNIILVKFMAHNGLALATSIGFLSNAILLLIGLKIKYPHIKVIDSVGKILKIIMASFAAISIAWFFYHSFNISVGPLIISKVLHLMLTVLVAVIIYLMLLILLKVEEVKAYLFGIIRKG